MSDDPDDRDQTEHERSLRSVDPRRSQAKYRPRLEMLDDDRVTAFERGMALEHFIFPDEPNRTRRRK